MRVRCQVSGPVDAARLATLRVEDAGKPWRVEERISWVERMAHSYVKKIAEGVALRSVDLFAKGRAIIGTDFMVAVEKAADVVVDVDLAGSRNVALADGRMAGRQMIRGFGTCTAANVQVCDTHLPWKLCFNYQWREEPGQQVAVGDVVRHELEAGLVLEVSRVSEIVVKYTVVSTAATAFNLLLDCSRSHNMHLMSGASQRRSVAFPRRSCELGCVEVIDPSQAWSLSVRISWAAGNMSGRGGDAAGSLPWAKELLVKQNVEEIEPGITLSTEQFASQQAGTRIVYTLEVRKDCSVTFSIDFSASSNLKLLAAKSMTRVTRVPPFTRTVVAELVAADNTVNRPWKLKCSYKWRAQAQEPPSFSSSSASSSAVAPPSLQALLAGLQLERYSELLRRNEMDLATLAGLTEEMLEALLVDCGVANHRHRDQIIAAIKQART